MVIEIRYPMELVPLGVLQPLVVAVGDRGAEVARIRPIVLQATHASTLQEGGEFREILLSPIAAKAWTASKRGSTRLPRLGADDVHLRTDRTACQQRIAPHLDAFGMGVVHQLLVSLDILLGNVLHVESAAKGDDDHLVTRLGTLVDSLPHHRGVCGGKMQEDGILGSPWSQGSIEAAREESLALAVVAVERHLENREGAEGSARGDALVRADIRSNLQDAGRVQSVIALRRVLGVLPPMLRDVRLALCETSTALIVTLDVDVG